MINIISDKQKTLREDTQKPSLIVKQIPSVNKTTPSTEKEIDIMKGTEKPELTIQVIEKENDLVKCVEKNINNQPYSQVKIAKKDSQSHKIEKLYLDVKNSDTINFFGDNNNNREKNVKECAPLLDLKFFQPEILINTFPESELDKVGVNCKKVLKFHDEMLSLESLDGVNREIKIFQSENFKGIKTSRDNLLPIKINKKLRPKRKAEPCYLGYKCPKCLKVFNTEWSLLKHSLTHRQFICNYCSNDFSSEKELMEHTLMHLINGCEDKHYKTFACKSCHSMKCGCIESSSNKITKNIYTTPQVAKRSKKCFVTEYNKGPNDHLKVSLDYYNKIVENSLTYIRNYKDSNVENVNLIKAESKSNKRIKISNESHVPIKKIDKTSDKSRATSGSAFPVKGESERRKNLREKNTVQAYKSSDYYYYLCELCDASFLSRAELNEHMFFHRLKSRRRRGEKRRSESEDERTSASKKSRNRSRAETVNIGGFERYKCPNCKGHFASIQDLNRHRTQAHRGAESESLVKEEKSTEQSLYQCNYCKKIYKRKKELLRHITNDCKLIPADIMKKIKSGLSFEDLAKQGSPSYIEISPSDAVDFLANKVNTEKRSISPVMKNPLKCNYCSTVTKRDREMKRHITFQCKQIPKSIKRALKDGKSLMNLNVCTPVESNESSSSSNVEDSKKINSENDKTSVQENDTKDVALSLINHLNEETQAIETRQDFEGFCQSSKTSTIWKCTKCNVILGSSEHHLAHTSLHVSESNSNLMCLACQTSFSKIKFLKEHVNIHLSNHIFGCHLCSETFVFGNDVIEHLFNMHQFFEVDVENVSKWKKLTFKNENLNEQEINNLSKSISLDDIAQTQFVSDNDLKDLSKIKIEIEDEKIENIEATATTKGSFEEVKVKQELNESIEIKSEDIDNNVSAVSKNPSSDDPKCENSTDNFLNPELECEISDEGEELLGLESLDSIIETVQLEDSHFR